MKNVAVVLAGGTGSRTGLPVPKQFLPLNGRTLIEYSVETFDGHPAIDEVAVVVHRDWRGEMENIVARNAWRKVTRIIDGGSERYRSTFNAIKAYNDYADNTNLLIHDAARPMVSTGIIDRVCEALLQHEAVGVALPSTDTVWEVGDMAQNTESKMTHTDDSRRDMYVSRIPERKRMWLAQTPQAFRLPLLRDAYQRALQDPCFTATDDCGVVHRYCPDTKIAVVEGDPQNMKVTYTADITMLNRNK